MVARLRALALALAVAAGAPACSDDSDQERASAALRAEMVANAGMTSRRPVDPEQTACVADGMVEELGVAKLQRYELLTDDLRAGESLEGVELEPQDADVLARVFTGCMDVEAMMEREIVSGLDLPRSQQRRASRCVRETVTTDHVTRMMALEFQGAGNPVFRQLRSELRSCLR